MLKNICILSIFISFIFGKEIEPKIIDYSNKTIFINVSKTQTNRIILPEIIRSKITSKEKGLEVTANEKEAFVKFSPIISTIKIVSADNKNAKIKNQKTVYENTEPVELYLLTKNKTYEFILNPKNITKQTIIIKDSSLNTKELRKISKNYEMSIPFKKQINSLMHSVFNNNTPIGYEKNNVLDVVANTNKIKIIKTSEYFGNRYKINLYKLKNKTKKGMEIMETALIPLVKNKIYAISIFYDNSIYKIPPNGIAKAMIIVDNKE